MAKNFEKNFVYKRVLLLEIYPPTSVFGSSRSFIVKKLALAFSNFTRIQKNF
jgi:hypothetical protein